MGSVKWGVVSVLVVVFMASFSVSLTDPRDVLAMNALCVSLNFPSLSGWIALGGDPCGDAWQGVSCVFANITSLKLNGLNLGGTLPLSMYFASIMDIDLSNNHIEGNIPPILPDTVKNFSISHNQISGTIPDTLSDLTQLIDLSFHSNLLSGEIPDSFQQMTSLTKLDLSGNNFSGLLPPSMGYLSSLGELHLQDNRLTGTLDVLRDLPLQYLNVENNLFSGPIPSKLLNIPTFRKDGNPFNTSIIQSPPPALAPSPGIPPVAEAPRKQANGPSASETPKSVRSKEFFTSKRVIWIAGIGVVVIILLGACLLMSICCKRRKTNQDVERHDIGAYKSHIDKRNSKSSFQQNNREKDQYGLDNRRLEACPKEQGEPNIDLKRMAAYSKQRMDHGKNRTGVDMNLMRPPLPPPRSPCLPTEKAITNPTGQAVRVFTIATLQQYTNSFSEESFVGEGALGSVYRAELPGGKLVAVKKLNRTAARQRTEEEFLQLVFSISKIQHDNIAELVGYCYQHGQQLLVYQYCENGTVYDALHADKDMHRKLSWNVRIRLALGAARALHYLHEVCQPPMMHQNFKASKILLDDKLSAQVSDCGLSTLKSSGSATELSARVLSAHGYDAPELESGSYTCRSDVYSFGVVMLELLTGRKSFDRSLGRSEQYLVRWAVPQLHDIDALSRMVDPSLNGGYPVKSLSRFADIISRCVQWEPEFRPPISEIVQDLLHML